MTASSRLRGWLTPFAEVRPGEGTKTLLMFLYFFLLMASYYVIKPVRNSLFLEKLGPEDLPYAYLGTAAVIGLVASAYTRLVARFERHLLIMASTAFFIANIVLFWWSFRLDIAWVAGLFYLWSAVFSVGAVTQFWSMSNEVFYPEEAKRLFGIVGGGGILGGIVGGVLASVLVGPLGSRHLLLVSAAILSPCLAITAAIHGMEGRLLREAAPARRAETPLARHEATVRSVMASSYTRLLALMMIAMVVVATLVDYEFNTVAAAAFPGKDAKTAFFGAFFAALSALSLVLQFFLTSPVLRSFGVGAALLLLPAALAASSLSVLVLPVLWSVAALKLADGSMRYSLNQSTREILFLPVPLAEKYSAKAIIDMALQRWARGGAALIILGAIFLHLSWTALALVTLAFCAAWIVIVQATGHEYLSSLGRLLEERPDRAQPALFERPTEVWPALSERGAIALAAAAAPEDLPRLSLSAPQPAVRLAALERLLATGRAIDQAQIGPLLADGDPAVRSRATALQASALLRAGAPAESIERLAGLITDAAPEVRRAACDAAARLKDSRLVPALAQALGLDCPGQAVEALASLGPPALPELGRALLGPTASGEGFGAHVARRLCQVIGRIGGPEAAAVLEAALAHPPLRLLALRALASMDPPAKLPKAADPERGWREAVRRGAWAMVVLADYAAGGGGPEDLPGRALVRAQWEGLEEAVLWCALLAPGRKLGLTLEGLSHGSKELRAASQELLEATLPRQAKALLRLVLSEKPWEEKAGAAAALANVRRRSFSAWLPDLLADASPAVRAGAIMAAANRLDGCQAKLEGVERGGSAIERVLARAALAHRQPAPAWT